VTEDEIEQRKIEARVRLAKGSMDKAGKELEEAERVAKESPTPFKRKLVNQAKGRYSKAAQVFDRAVGDKMKRELGGGKDGPGRRM
jgi:hypothetical protein